MLIVFGLLWYYASSVGLQALGFEVERRFKQQAGQSAVTASMKLQSIVASVEKLASNPLLVDSLGSDFAGQGYVERFFEAIELPGPEGASISLANIAGEVTASNGRSRSFAPASWFKAAVRGEKVVRISVRGMVVVVPVQNELGAVGFVALEYGPLQIPRIFDISFGTQVVAVSHESGTVLFSSNEEFARTGFVFDKASLKDWLIVGLPIPDFEDLVLLSGVPHGRGLQTIAALQRFMLAEVIFTLLAISAGIFLTAYFATKPLARFINSTRRVRHGADLGYRMRPSGAREFHDLATAFNSMFERLEKTTTSRDYVDGIMNSISEMILVTDMEGRIRSINRAVREALGYDTSQLEGQSISILYPDLNQPKVSADSPTTGIREDVFIGIEENDLSHRIRRVPVRINSSVLKDDEGEDVGIIYVARDITEQREAEAAAERAEERLAEAIESMADGFALFDSEDRFIRCNTLFLSLYPASASRFVAGRKFESLMRHIANSGDVPAAEGREDSWVHERQAQRLSSSNYNEQELADGRLIRISEQRTRGGGTVGIYSDITEMKLRERALQESQTALQESEARLKIAERLAVMGHWEWDYNSDAFTYVSPEAAAIFGVSVEQLKGNYETFLGFVHPDDRERLREDHVRVNNRPQRYAIDFRVMRPDGQVRYIQSFAQPIANSPEDETRAVGAYQDVTDRRLAEMAVQQSEAQLAAILDNSPTSIYLKSLDGRYLLVNREFLRVNEVTRRSVLEGTARDLYPAWLSRKFESHDQEVIASGDAVAREIVDQPRSDGLHTYWVIKFPIRDAEGKMVALGGIETDVTERKRDEEKLSAYMEALERSNRDLEEFASVASHDLQEPLRKIQAFGDRLSRKHGDALGEDGQDSLSRMTGAAERMQMLITELLAFSRVTSKAEPFVPVDLGDVVQEVIGDLEVAITDTEALVTVGELPVIDADPRQMRQLFQNLIGNALKFKREGVAPVVTIGEIAPETTGDADSAAAESFCRISVRDNGIGIEQKYLERVFEVFQRLHGRTQYPGTGMGLAICRRIAEFHGGEITADSKVGEGTEFMVSLPRYHEV